MKGGGDPEHLRPGNQVGENQRQRSRHQSGDPVGIDMHGIAKPKLVVAENLAAEGIQGDILRRRKKSQGHRQPDHRCQIGRRREAAEQADRQQQTDLREQHPAAPATEWQAVAIEQRRPEELPGVGKLDQREETDDLEVDAVAAQPGRQQVQQEVERQA
jgi:hypothetical protein